MKTAAIALAAFGMLAATVKPVHVAADDRVYEAQLHAMNNSATNGKTGRVVRFSIHGDSLTIHTRLHDVPPGIEHWQHFHGFPQGGQSNCPDIASDANHDQLIDIRETEPAAGTTMVPFNADPVGMDIPTHTYPHASSNGEYNYTRTVSLAALPTAFGG